MWFSPTPVLLAMVAPLSLGVLTGCPSDRAAPAGPSSGPKMVVPEATTDGRPRLRTVLVSDLTPPDRRPVDLSLESDAVLRSALLSPGAFAPATADELSACAAEIDVMYAWVVNGEVVLKADEGVARVVVDGQMHCLPPAGSGDTPESFRADFSDERPFRTDGPTTGEEALRELLGELGRRVAGALFGQVLMRHATETQVLAALARRDSVGLLMEAASEAGERRLRSAVPALIGLTVHSEPVVGLRAGASLGLVGDPRDEVIEALAAMTRGADTERHLVAVHALGDLGGERAARYLDTLAVGHPLPPVREAARLGATRARRPRRAE